MKSFNLHKNKIEHRPLYSGFDSGLRSDKYPRIRWIVLQQGRLEITNYTGLANQPNQLSN
jgi:hypothetical protein